MRPIAELTRRLLGESHEITLKMRLSYARALYEDPAATLDDVREAVTMFEDAERIARRVLGGAHPNSCLMAGSLREARKTLRAREMLATLPVPRFKVGARVECNVKAKFLEGTVVRHHYRESDWEPGVFAPYQVKLDGRSPGLVFASWDQDDCIRAAAADSDAETV